MPPTKFMSVSTFFNGRTGDHFLRRLMRQRTIAICYVHNRASATIYMPEDWGCNRSSRFRHLCGQNEKRTFHIDEVLEETQEAFAKKLALTDKQFNDMLEAFVKWVYSDAPEDIARMADVPHRALWYFGQRIGAPGFQNCILRSLCMDPAWSPDEADVQVCFDFAHNWKGGVGQKFVDERQKMFLSILDFLIYVGSNDDVVKKVLIEGGLLALLLAQRLARVSKPRSPPWDPNNIEKYMLCEELEDEEA